MSVRHDEKKNTKNTTKTMSKYEVNVSQQLQVVD